MNRIIVITGEIITYAIQTREMGKKKNSKMIATETTEDTEGK